MRNAIAIANGKGGVGKTTLAANLAGLAALTGWEVLAIDLDRQANLGDDLGYRGTDGDDGGRSLYEAVTGATPLTPAMRNVRKKLDVLPGGRWAAELSAGLVGGDPHRLADTLKPAGPDYDLVVLDCPPADETMIGQALVAARGLVVPVRPDAASLQGLQLMADQYRDARRHNPQLRLLGVVLFGVSQRATAIRSEVRATLEEALGDIAPVLDATIRYVERPAYDMRLDGLLAHEYEDAADHAKRRRLSMLHEGASGDQLPRHSRAAGGLAGDFTAVADQILTRLVDNESNAEARVQR